MIITILFVKRSQLHCYVTIMHYAIELSSSSHDKLFNQAHQNGRAVERVLWETKIT